MKTKKQPGRVENFDENWVDQTAGVQRVSNDLPALSHAESLEENEPRDEDSTIEYSLKDHELDHDGCLIMDE